MPGGLCSNAVFSVNPLEPLEASMKSTLALVSIFTLLKARTCPGTKFIRQEFVGKEMLPILPVHFSAVH